MVENMYVIERLAEMRVQEELRRAEQSRLARTASEGSRSGSIRRLLTWIPAADTTRPVPKRA